MQRYCKKCKKHIDDCGCGKTEKRELPVDNIVSVYDELDNGGEWLGAARRWMQSNVIGGDRLYWGSKDFVTLPFFKLEELAKEVAAYAILHDRQKR